jgi:Di-haem oxidoreductase, putative peroxidase
MVKKPAAFACLLVAGAVVACLAATPVSAQEGLPSDPEVDDGPAHTATADLTQEEVESDAEPDSLVYLRHLRQLGLSVFSTPFNTYDGMGDGPFDPAEVPPLIPGHRPTLQGNDLSLRVNGLDSQSCNECHNIVDEAARPPVLGLGGVGGISQAAIVQPSVIDVADSFDDRVQYVPGHHPDLPLVFDGVADFNGRFINPPFLYGGGGIEELAKEMTRELQEILDGVQHSLPGFTASLDTHGVHFGTATKVNRPYPLDVAFNLEGIGVEDYKEKLKSGEITPEELLVVRPFGRKGERFSMRDFDNGAMSFHFGIQPVEQVGDIDEDGDGVIDELTVAEMSVLDIFSVTNPPPVQFGGSDDVGYERFKEVGCANCHIPTLNTKYRYLPLAYPEVPEDPDANVYRTIDLVRVGFASNGGGVAVPLFADLKRHKMGGNGLGDGLKEDFDDERRTIANDEFTTARLWGVADTAPYLHDGRATTLYQAIVLHGGEAQAARDAFVALSPSDKLAIINFLKTLHAPANPNQELLPLP